MQIDKTTDGEELIDFKEMLRSTEDKVQELKTNLAKLQKELQEIGSELEKVKKDASKPS